MTAECNYIGVPSGMCLHPDYIPGMAPRKTCKERKKSGECPSTKGGAR